MSTQNINTITELILVMDKLTPKVLLPSRLEGIVGYKPLSNKVARYFSIYVNRVGDQLVVDDGFHFGPGDLQAWKELLAVYAASNPEAGQMLSKYQLASKHRLLVDRKMRILYAGPATKVAKVVSLQWYEIYSSPAQIQDPKDKAELIAEFKAVLDELAQD